MKKRPEGTPINEYLKKLWRLTPAPRSMKYIILNIVLLLAAVVLAGLALSPLVDDLIRNTVEEKINSPATKRDLAVALKEKANEEIIKLISEKQGTVIDIFIRDKKWRNMETAAQQATGDFIDDEITSNRLYIQVHTYPEAGRSWCITCYEFELTWAGERVALFRLNYALQPADYTENMDSKFIKTLEKKAAKAALWGR